MKENKMKRYNRDMIGDCFPSGCLIAKEGDLHVKVLAIRPESRYTWSRSHRENGQTRLKDR